MKKKLILLSSFLFAMGAAGCARPKQDTPVIDNGGGNGGQGGGGGGGTVEPEKPRRNSFSDYADENGQLTDDGWKRMIKDSYKFCEQEEEQGSVLLFNKVVNGKKALPLSANERNVSLFGQGTRKMFLRSGAGGAAPNEKLVVNLEKAFESNGFNINRTLLEKYSTGYVTNPDNNYEASSSIYTDEVKASFSSYNDAAIITLVRAGTEDNDPNSGMLELHSNEKAMIKIIKDSGKFNKIILILNSPMPMSMDWVDSEDYGVDAALWIGAPGYYGTAGAVHVLMGKDGDGKPLSPSGHLSATFAAKADSSPAMVNFGNRNISVYKEGIYVGYKYYETRYEDLVLGRGNADSAKGVKQSNGAWNYADEVAVPFGYGESYTTFEPRITGLNYNRTTDQYEVEIEVKNTGTIDAKYSGQVYAQQPYTTYDKEMGLGKSAIALMGYEKVDVKAGQTVKFTVNVDKYFLATYDYVGAKTYILEGGDYYFAIGNGAHEALNNILAIKSPNTALYDHNGKAVVGDASCAKKVVIQEDKTTYSKSHYDDSVEVTNKFDDADYDYYARKNSKTPITYLSREDWDATWPTQTTTSCATDEDKDMSRLYASTSENKGYAAADGIEYNVPAVINGEETEIAFAEMANVPLEGIVTNENSRFKGMEGEDVWDMFIKQMSLDDLAISVTDNRGLLSVNKIRKPGNSMAEGPEGLLSSFQFGDKRWATGFATGCVYTSTWDHQMQKKFGSFYAEEALYCGVAAVNGPGANIVRTAYTSRASEYMSEDGILNYNCAANVISAARNKGLVMNIKHALLNNQEDGRQRIETYCNEQAIREIYLRPFEGALAEGKSLGVMTSYNRIGTTYSACHSNLMNGVMRGEWNFDGLIIDDALTGSNSDRYSNGPAMLYNGTDVFCLDGRRGSDLASYIRSNDDLQILKALQRANKNIMYALSRSWMCYDPNEVDFDDNPSGGTSSSDNPGGDVTVSDPITNEIKAAANAYDYDFDPTEVHFKKEDLTDGNGTFDFNSSDVTTLPTNGQRDGYNLVYKFEGSYAEGWQGDYSKTYAYLYLWEDGKFAGTSGSTQFRGYWYDSNEAEEGNTLVMVTSNNADGEIIAYEQKGFYQWIVDLNSSVNGGRRIKAAGYMYYPEVALFIDTNDTDLNNLTSGSTLDIGFWTAQRVLKNLKYSSCFEDNSHSVTWKVNGTPVNNSLINLNTAGAYVITATWGDLEASVVINVK